MSEIETQILEFRSKGKCDASMKLLVDTYYRMVYSLAYRMFLNHDDALDASQEALIQIDRSIGRFRGDSRLSTWIYGLASRVFLRWHRDTTRKTRKNQSDSDDWIASLPAPAGDEPDSVCERKHREKMLEAALQKIPSDRRMAIILHDLEGMSVPETARIMGRNVPAVKSLIHRGRQSLKVILGEGFIVSGEEEVGVTALGVSGLQ